MQKPPVNPWLVHEVCFLLLTASAAALYHTDAAMAPGSGTDARISPAI